jgi:hypothetical protein
VAHRALSAASTITRFFAEHALAETPFETFAFGVKIGLAVGEVVWGMVGDIPPGTAPLAEGTARVLYYFRGAAIDDCTAAEHRAAPGEIWATAALTRLLPSLRTRPETQAPSCRLEPLSPARLWRTRAG